MGHLSKPSKELVIDLINKANPKIHLGYDDVDVENPLQAPVGTVRNTIVTLRGRVNAEGIGYRNTRNIRYDRLSLPVKIPPNEGSTTEVMVPNDGPESKLDICARLNKTYDIMLGPDDIVDGPVDSSVLPVTVTIAAKASSLAWTGSIKVELTPARPMYKGTFSSLTMDGLPAPTVHDAALDTPTVQTNHAPTFVTDGKLHQPGDGAYPADAFVVGSNPEIEVAVAPRVGTGAAATAPDATGHTYALQLADAADWALMLSIGSLANPAVPVESNYNVQVQVTGPAGSTLTLNLIKDATGYALVSGTKSLRTLTAVDAGTLQGALSMADLVSALGQHPSNAAGGALGDYAVRVIAHRRNTIVPMVLAACKVHVVN